MKTQIGQLVGANLHEGTLEIEVGEDIIAKAGKYAVVPIDDYERLVKFSLDDVSGRFYEGEELNDIPFGLYKIYWNEESEGGTSIASVGNMHDGVRWIAPTNWTSKDSPIGRMDKFRDSIEKMELLYKHGH
jgi:hypothetical protein